VAEMLSKALQGL